MLAAAHIFLSIPPALLPEPIRSSAYSASHLLGLFSAAPVVGVFAFTSPRAYKINCGQVWGETDANARINIFSTSKDCRLPLMQWKSNSFDPALTTLLFSYNSTANLRQLGQYFCRQNKPNTKRVWATLSRSQFHPQFPMPHRRWWTPWQYDCRRDTLVLHPDWFRQDTRGLPKMSFAYE